MLKIFISSHGRLASGIKSSLDILLGNSQRVYVFDAYLDERSVQEVLDRFYQKNVREGDQVVLLSDLYGGSVNSTMYLYLQKPNTLLVSGINLALVLELAIREEAISKTELEQIVQQSREALRIVELEIETEVEEDFF